MWKEVALLLQAVTEILEGITTGCERKQRELIRQGKAKGVHYHQTRRYLLTPVKLVLSIKQQTRNVDLEKRELSCTVGGNSDSFRHCGKQYGYTSENCKWNILIALLLHFWKYT